MRHKLVVLIILGFVLFSIPCFGEDGHIQLINSTGDVVFTTPIPIIFQVGITTVPLEIKTNSGNTWCSGEGQWQAQLYVPKVDIVGGSNTSSPVDAHFVNWDEEQDACECYLNNNLGISTNYLNQELHWLDTAAAAGVGEAGGKCCGDDEIERESGWVEGNRLCAVGFDKDKPEKESVWQNPIWSQNLLRIFNFETQDTISSDVNGASWHECIATPGAGTIDAGSDALRLNKNDRVPVEGNFEYAVSDGLAYICTEKVGQSRISECCSDARCVNREWYPDKIMASGSSTTVIFDGGDNFMGITGDLVDNVFATYSVSSAQDGRAAISELRIKNWTDYQTLEFDMMFESGIYKEPSKILIYNGENIFLSQDIKQYTHYPLPDVWQHYVIDISTLNPKNDIRRIEIIRQPDTPGAIETARIHIDNMMLRDDNVFYCTGEKRTWVSDLDPQDSNIEQYQEACDSNRAYAWVGEYASNQYACCGDDTGVQINDGEFMAGTDAGCWDSKPVKFNDTVGSSVGYVNESGILNDVMYTDDMKFKVCGEVSKYSSVEKAAGLLESGEYCTIAGERFCSYANTWSIEAINNNLGPFAKDRNTTKSRPEMDEQELRDMLNVPETTEILDEQCCPRNYCWAGYKCVKGVPYVNSATNTNIGDSYSLGFSLAWNEVPANDLDGPDSLVCYDNEGVGEWTDGYIKYSYDYEGQPNNALYFGICIENSQCYSKDLARCVDSQEYYRDHYCEDGVWTSRTKKLAEKLLTLVPEGQDYDLFCDDYDFTLNRNFYVLDQIKGSDVKTNNYCTLETGNEVYMGTSFNFPIETTEFLTLMDYNDCNAVDTDDGEYHGCTSDVNDKAWYNNKTGILIYSNGNFVLESPTAGEIFVNLFIHPLRTLQYILNPTKLSKGSWINIVESANISFVNLTKDYNNIYAAKSSELEISGIRENVDKDRAYYYVVYNGTQANLCDKVFSIFLGQTSLGCDNETVDGKNIYYVLTQYDPDPLARGSTTLNIWRSLSAKLRP